MLAFYRNIQSWLEAGERVAIATVIQTWGSSPRPIGSQMAITESGKMIGSVSGGCVEAKVIETAQHIIKSGIPEKLHFSVSHEMAFEAGLSCGGEMDVFVQPFHNEGAQAALMHCLNEKGTGTYFIRIDHDGAQKKDFFLKSETERINATTTGLDQPQYMLCEDSEIFSIPIYPPFQLIVVGAGHIAVKLAEFAKILDYDVHVIDPRSQFVTPERFPSADTLSNKWPEVVVPKFTLYRATAIVVLTHDPKIDDPVLKFALNSPAVYIGALGSKKTHQQRVDRLSQAGFSDEQINRIHGPIGLKLGTNAADEIALGIIAEIVKVIRL